MHTTNEPRGDVAAAPVRRASFATPVEPPDFLLPEPPQETRITRSTPSRRDRIAVEVLRLVARNAIVSILVVGLAGVLGGVTTFFMKPYYVAQASIFPPPSDNPLGSLGMAGVAAGLVGGLGMGGSTTQFPLYEKFVYSRRLVGEVLQARLDEAGYAGTLLDYLDVREPDAARRLDLAIEACRARLGFEADKQTGVIAIRFTDANPRIAAHVVNGFVHGLDRFDVSTANERARERRQFVERRLAESADSLAQAERRLQAFGDENLRIGRAPELLLEQGRLTREVEFAQQVYLTLRKEFELARLEEEKSVPVVNVLDLATPPTQPAGPSLVKNAATGGLVAAVLLALVFGTIAAEPRRLWAEFVAGGAVRAR